MPLKLACASVAGYLIAVAPDNPSAGWYEQGLQNAMLEHLRLHFNNEEASDEQVNPDFCFPAHLYIASYLEPAGCCRLLSSG